MYNSTVPTSRTKALKDSVLYQPATHSTEIYSTYVWLPPVAMGTTSSRPNNNRPRNGFEENPTVFGKILRGEKAAHVLLEDDQVLCFQDHSPASEFHALVITKRLIEHSGKATANDVLLLRHMEQVACRVLHAEYPALNVDEARENGTISLGYHKSPLISVHHLHLVAASTQCRVHGTHDAPSRAPLLSRKATVRSTIPRKRSSERLRLKCPSPPQRLLTRPRYLRQCSTCGMAMDWALLCPMWLRDAPWIV